MDGFLWGLAGGVAMLFIGGVVSTVKKRYKKVKAETSMLQKHEKKLCDLSEMVVLLLKVNMALGDGMVELGVNGNVKKSLAALKDEIINKVGD